MRERFLTMIETASVPTFFMGAIVIKALLLLVVIPWVTSWASGHYGLSFADDYNLLARNILAGNGYRFFPETGVSMAREPGYLFF